MPTRLDSQDLVVCSREFGLGDRVSSRLIEAGTINTNYQLVTSTGRFFLRVNEGKSEEQVRYELNLVTALSARGVVTPVPQRAADGRPFVVVQDRFISLFPWVEGVHLNPATMTPADAGRLGQTLARLHLSGRDLLAGFAQPGIYTWERIRERLDRIRRSSDPVARTAAATLDQEVAWIDARSALRRAEPQGIIHGDLFPDNVLFATERQTLWMIDFEQASTGSLVYDLAVCLNAWCFGNTFVTELLTAMARGYHAERPLSADEIRALPIELRASAVRFSVTRITDVYLAGQNRAGKDFRRYMARLSAWQTTPADQIAAWFR